jgi:hypothetical protein
MRWVITIGKLMVCVQQVVICFMLLGLCHLFARCVWLWLLGFWALIELSIGDGAP